MGQTPPKIPYDLQYLHYIVTTVSLPNSKESTVPMDADDVAAITALLQRGKNQNDTEGEKGRRWIAWSEYAGPFVKTSKWNHKNGRLSNNAKLEKQFDTSAVKNCLPILDGFLNFYIKIFLYKEWIQKLEAYGVCYIV